MARRSLKGPIVIFVVVLVLTITLTVLWNVVLVKDYLRIADLVKTESERTGAFHTTFIAVGSTLFVAILVLVSILGAWMFSAITWSRRQQNFLASISHELNSPLQSIKLQTQTLSRHAHVSDQDQKFLQMILEDVDRLAGLIANVLRAAQIDQNRMTVHAEAIAMRDFLQTYVERTQSMFDRTDPRRRIQLLPGEEFVVEADRALLRQLLENLVDNAVKYSPADRCEITLSLQIDNTGELQLAVADRGIGLPQGERRRIFDRFYRIEDDSPDRSRKGTGLGLSIVRSIAEAHGWAIFARSSGPGEGTTIRFEIPRFEHAIEETVA